MNSREQDAHRTKFTNNLAGALKSLVNMVDYCDKNDEVLEKIEEKRLQAQSTGTKVPKRIIRLEHALDQLRDSSKPSTSSQTSSSKCEDPSPIKMRLKSKMKQQEADEAAAREHLIINTPKYFDKDICKQLIEACRRPKNPTVRLNYQYPPIDPRHMPEEQNLDDSSSSSSSIIEVSSPIHKPTDATSSEPCTPTSEFKEFDLSEQFTKKRLTSDEELETDLRSSKRTKGEDSSSVHLINKRTRVLGDYHFNALLKNDKADSIIANYMNRHHASEEKYNETYSIHEREILGHYFSSVNYKVTDLDQMKQYFEDKRSQIAQLSMTFENCSDNETISEDVYDYAREKMLIGMYRMIAINMIAFSKSEIESTRKVSNDLMRVQNDSSRIADLSVRINYICDEMLKATKKSAYDSLPDFNLGKK